MEELIVARVDRDKNRQARRVDIEVGVIGISFIKKNGQVIEVPHSRTRLDGARISDDQSLEMPDTNHIIALRRAAAILNEKR